MGPQVTPGHHMQKMSQQTIQRRMPGPPLPRPVLPRERGYMDRVVEYLVGDGPHGRYALICKQCQSHNGMALKEEFEFIAFRCCYCYYWNPARKQRPVAPKLQQPPIHSVSSTDSSSEEGPSNEMEDNKPELEKSTDVLEPHQHDKTTTSLDSKDEEMDLT